MVHITFIVGWVALIGIGVGVGTVAMPDGGEAGVLPAFHGDPLAPGNQASLHTTETPGLSAFLGAGWWRSPSSTP